MNVDEGVNIHLSDHVIVYFFIRRKIHVGPFCMVYSNVFSIRDNLFIESGFYL